MQLLDFIVCDDVRSEVGSKMSLMGVMPGDINVRTPPGEPFALRLGVYVRVKLAEGEPCPDAFAFEISQSGKTIVEGVGPIVSKNPTLRYVAVGVNVAQLPVGYGELSFKVTFRVGEVPEGDFVYSLNIVEAV